MSQAVLPHAQNVEAESAAAVRSRAGLSAGVRALLLILVCKAVVLALVWLSYGSLDFATEVYEDQAHFHKPSDYGLLTRFTTWDASHYLLLARDGYVRDVNAANAFPPLLPLLIRGAGQLTGDLVVAGLIVSNAASAAALWLLWSLARRRWNEAAAWRSLALLLAFPTAFFLSLVYTESLFLLLAVTTFWGLDAAMPDSRRGGAAWGLAVAAVAAALMPLTRAIGAVIVLPILLWAIWPQLQGLQRPTPAAVLRALSWQPRLLLALAPLAGVLADALFMQAAAGDWLAHVHGETLFPAQWELTNAFKPWVFASELAGRGISLHAFHNSAIDRLFFAAFLLSAPLVYRLVPRTWFVFYLLLGLLPPLLGSFMAYTRLLLPAFPLFIAWGRWLEAKPRLFSAWLALTALVQALFILAHTSNHWIA